MKIGYNKYWGLLFLMLGGLNCCAAVIFVRADEAIPTVFVGSFWMLVLLGALFFTRSYVEIRKDSLLIKPLIGSWAKRYGFQSAKDFSIEGRDVFVMHNGARQKLPVALWLADRRGWASFLEWIKTGNGNEEVNL